MMYPDDDSSGEEQRHIYSVGELNAAAGGELEQQFASVWVTGELHQISRPASGHWYMTLKDDEAELRCVMFRRDTQQVAQPPNQGDQLNIKGSLAIYAARGQYQMIARQMEPAGEGLLLRRFAELRDRLQKEGLFDSDRKQPLPQCPHHIAVITSPTGAAIRDVLAVAARRAPLLQITVIPAVVQGDSAAPSLCRAMDICEQWNRTATAGAGFDALLLCRGGGSLTDLWGFNEEAVVRRIANLSLPCISGVGHEVDYTLSDFAADARAATPSAAAELLTEWQLQHARRLQQAVRALQQDAQQRIAGGRQRLQGLQGRLISPFRQMERQEQRLDELMSRLRKVSRRQQARRRQYLQGLQGRLWQQLHGRRALTNARSNLHLHQEKLLRAIGPAQARRRRQLAEAAARLSALNPMDVLQRGYAVVRNQSGQILRSAADAAVDEPIRVRLAVGELGARVTAVAVLDGQEAAGAKPPRPASKKQ